MNARKQLEKEHRDYMNDLYVKDAERLKEIEKEKRLKRNNSNSSKNR